MVWSVSAGVFLGWGLGANDASNVFGTAVSSQMVRWRTAAILITIFALLGALLQGGNGMHTYNNLVDQNLDSAFYTALAAGITVLIMTILKLPVSTCQAAVGAILGIGYARLHFDPAVTQSPDLSSLSKVVACWVGTPVGAAVLSIILYPLLALLIRKINPHFLAYDRWMRIFLILGGVYGSYALGANNVANVTGVFYGAGAFDNSVGIDPKQLALLIGGASIGLGALTYSRSVMMTVGKSIVTLDSFSALVVVLSEAVTVHVFAEIGVPVSTSQAVVGAVLGVGLIKGARTIRLSAVGKIFAGWLFTPAVAMAVAYGLWGLTT